MGCCVYLSIYLSALSSCMHCLVSASVTIHLCYYSHTSKNEKIHLRLPAPPAPFAPLPWLPDWLQCQPRHSVCACMYVCVCVISRVSSVWVDKRTCVWLFVYDLNDCVLSILLSEWVDTWVSVDDVLSLYLQDSVHAFPLTQILVHLFFSYSWHNIIYLYIVIDDDHEDAACRRSRHSRASVSLAPSMAARLELLRVRAPPRHSVWVCLFVARMIVCCWMSEWVW